MFIYQTIRCQSKKTEIFDPDLTYYTIQLFTTVFVSLGFCYGSVVRMLKYYRGLPNGISRYSDSLRAGRSGDRIPVEERFSAPAHTGPGVHPASCTMGIGPFPGVKRPGRGADHPPPSKRRGHERVGLYLWAFVACYRENQMISANSNVTA